MANAGRIIIITMLGLLSLTSVLPGRNNPDLLRGSSTVNIGQIPLDIDNVVCDVGAIHNLITNSTSERATGTNDWTILIGDDSAVDPSMLWIIPGQYAENNHYLYFASLRIGYNGHQIMLSNDTSPGIDVLEPPESISDFDTHFYISDQSPLLPDQYKVGVLVHQSTYAWAESDADDFIIYDYTITNISDSLLDSIYVALHADCDISTAEGGTGAQAWSRDDMVSYYRDYDTGEFISYMYDSDNPAIPGNDQGGHQVPRESAGYIGSRLLYCPARVGESTETVQSGHTWWDWNSDPSDDAGFAEWFLLMSDGIWTDNPPSPHDFRFFQKTGPFEIEPGDSISVVFAFGIGEGLSGMRSNLNNARLLYENDYVYYNLPPNAPIGFKADTSGFNIQFDWIPNVEDDLAGYNIYLATEPNGPFSSINAVTIDDTTYLYSPPQRDLFYCYITAEDITGIESTTSDTLMVSTLPAPPGNLRAIPGNHSVSLVWDTVVDADAYRIYRAESSGGLYSQIEQIIDPGHNYIDNDVVNGFTYYYVGTTIEGLYESPYSGEIEVTPSASGINNGRVLLVDDYIDRDDDGNPLDYQFRCRFYERWGVHNFDYDVWSIGDSGMVDLSTLLNYQAVLFASDGELGQTDMTWWNEVGDVGGGVLREYLNAGGHLLAIGQLILLDIADSYPTPPQPGDFEYDWFGIGSQDPAWDYWDDFTWAIGAEPGYPDSMKIDVAKNGDQQDYAISIYSIRSGVDTLFLKGLDVYGEPPEDYLTPVGIIYRPGGVAKTSLINFSLYYMPDEAAQQTMNNILRNEFSCTFYTDPAPLPPWQAEIISLPGNLISLTWDAIDEDDVVAIKIYRSIFDGPFELIATLDSDVGEYLDDDITPGTEYNYKLSSVDFAGQEGRPSRTLTEYGGRPSAPNNLAAQSSYHNVHLSWTIPNDPAITEFRIYRKSPGGNEYQLFDNVPSNTSNYNDNNVNNMHPYYYYLTSNTGYGVESYPSDIVFALPHSAERSGLLIVNGCDWNTYGSEIEDFYEEEVPAGFIDDYFIWDLFDDTPGGVIPDADKLLGNGELPSMFFDIFAKIVWVGNAYSGDEQHWQNNQDNIMNYLNTNGNLLLMCRYGSQFLFDELQEFAGITALHDGYNPTGLVAQHDSLTDISRIGSLSFTTLVDVNTDIAEILYRADNDAGLIAGIWSQGPAHTGNFIYLAGRPYRHDREDLKQNVDVMLRYFLEAQVDIDDPENALPAQYELAQNYPNPFNPSTTIKLGVPQKSNVKLQIYDVLGRQVRTLIDSKIEAGYHEVIWDGKTQSGEEATTGIYFYRLQAGDFKSVKKMLILK